MTNDEYKISCEGLSHCPQHKYGKKRWGESIDCTDYDNADSDVGMYIHYSDTDKAYYLMGEYYDKGVDKLGWSYEIEYCPFCGRKL